MSEYVHLDVHRTKQDSKLVKYTNKSERMPLDYIVSANHSFFAVPLLSTQVLLSPFICTSHPQQ